MYFKLFILHIEKTIQKFWKIHKFNNITMSPLSLLTVQFCSNTKKKAWYPLYELISFKGAVPIKEPISLELLLTKHFFVFSKLQKSKIKNDFRRK